MCEKINPVIEALKGTANYVACSKPGYDCWSGPGVLPHAYCKYFGGDNSDPRSGFCGVRLAEAYEGQIKTGKVNIHENAPNPYIYYPVTSQLKDIMAEDVRGNPAGLEPERCVRCVQNLDGRVARGIIRRVLRKLK